MGKKERNLGLRLTGALADAIEAYCEQEERTLSGAVRFLLTREMERLGYLPKQSVDAVGGRTKVKGKSGRA